MSTLTVFVPANEPSTFIHGNTTYAARMFNGRLVIDLPQMIFREQILLGKQGLAWQRENPEALEWLGRNDHLIMSSNAFPGAGRPPPVAPVVVEAAPVVVRLIAPEGVSAYSFEGAEHKVGKDGSVTVTDHVASVLRSHGFKDAA
jgi:hypothetical protein